MCNVFWRAFAIGCGLETLESVLVIWMQTGPRLVVAQLELFTSVGSCCAIAVERARDSTEVADDAVDRLFSHHFLDEEIAPMAPRLRRYTGSHLDNRHGRGGW